MNFKDKKGSISVFVLVGLLFMASFLIISYANIVNKSKVVKDQFSIIKTIYSKGDSENSYEETYTNIRKNNKQILTANTDNATVKSSLELTKTFEDKINNYRIYGNSTQDGTPTIENPIEVKSVGDTANLFDYNNTKLTSSADSYVDVINEEGKFSFKIKEIGGTGSAYGRDYSIKINPDMIGKQMTISAKISKSGKSNFTILCDTFNGTTYVKRLNDYANNNNHTFTIPEGVTELKIRIVAIFNSSSALTDTATISDVMLNYGSKALDYEAYGNYKIPVKVMGRNLLKLNTTNTRTVNGITLTYNSDGTFTINGTAINTAINTQFAIATNFNLKAGNYYLTSNNENCVLQYNISTYPKNTSFILSEETTKHIILQVGVRNTHEFNNEVIKPILNYGDSNIEFEPYKEKDHTIDLTGHEPLRKLGDYADYIDFKEGKIVRYIKEKVFTGDEPIFRMWATSVTELSSGIYWASNEELGIYQSPTFITANLSTHFVISGEGMNTKRDDLLGKFAAVPSSSPPYIAFKVPYTNLDDWRNFLRTQYNNGNPVKVYYVLKEPIVEDITLPELETFEDYTNIQVLTEIAPSKLEVEYQGYTLD